MSGMRGGGLDLDLAEKIAKTINLQADTFLKEAQRRTRPWKSAVSRLAAGTVFGGFLVALLGWKIGS